MTDVSHLKNLGSSVPYNRYSNPTPVMLEVFDNPNPDREYMTTFVFREFSSLCPKTGAPDFGVITIQYVADKHCIETKSLKIYLGAYRMEGAFMEAVTNKILDDLVSVCNPKIMRINAEFNTRGGTDIAVTATYEKED